MYDPRSIRRALLEWYEKNRRALPWREIQDPYAILVSEVLLQQTRVHAGEAYYRRFMARFPTAQILAQASLDEVLRVWEGLGYYRRAHLLHAAAKEIVTHHHGQVPRDIDALIALPGVGPYTAGAVASIAYGQSVPAVDGNVTRVLARLYRIEEDVALSTTKTQILDEATRLVPQSDPGTFNQALMELGALVCLPKVPRCGECPIVSWCAARASGMETSLPRRGPRPAVPAVTAVFALIERPDAVLLVRRKQEGLLGGLWALPGGEIAHDESPRDGLRRLLRERHGLEVEPGPEVGRHVHTFTHKRWNAVGIRCSVEGGARPAGMRWTSQSELGRLPMIPFHRAFVAGGRSPSLEAFS